MSIELKIKQKSLVAESKIIRDEEEKLSDRIYLWLAKTPERTSKITDPQELEKYLKRAEMGRQRLESNRNNLSRHRRGIVRHESRITHLARGYLRGLPYDAMEAAVHKSHMLKPAQWDRVLELAYKYHPERYTFQGKQNIAQAFEEWKQAGLAGVKVV